MQPNALLDTYLDELAASWNGTTDQVGYAFAPAPGAEPSVGWLDRSGSADRLLELADRLRITQPAAGRQLQEMAVLVLRPVSNGSLQCVVVASEGAALAEISPSRLRELNAPGLTDGAREARGNIVESMSKLAVAGLMQRVAGGRSIDEAVVLILDPTDARAAPLAAAIGAAPGQLRIPSDARRTFQTDARCRSEATRSGATDVVRVWFGGLSRSSWPRTSASSRRVGSRRVRCGPTCRRSRLRLSRPRSSDANSLSEVGS